MVNAILDGTDAIMHRIDMMGTTEELIAYVDQKLQDDKLIAAGEHVVLMGGMPVAGQARTNFVKLQHVGEGKNEQ